mmetsp:Transcript_10204/g.30143  ORF Transcript_10204/g.30143 Transcript_10204/m.30143 type:complete len:196 (-) Transcript_10204:148-735(-)
MGMGGPGHFGCFAPGASLGAMAMCIQLNTYHWQSDTMGCFILLAMACFIPLAIALTLPSDIFSSSNIASCPFSRLPVVWMAAAAAVAKYADVFGAMLHDPRVIRPVFNAALGLLGINAVLTLYLAVYLPRIVGIKDCTAWEAYCPRVIPTITVLGILCGFLLVRSLWPVWGVLTPLVLGVESLGALFSLHFIPWL